MAMNSAERQKRLRNKRKYQGKMTGDKSLERINTWVTLDAKLALEALSHLHAKTQREILEMLLRSAAGGAPRDEYESAMWTVLNRRLDVMQ